ncbi:MAG: aldehyde dehydrogenase family protein, partial [Alphaproteobacteria bacterium]|nr:aldehyde dehydrogenase family protein [Alphaproteobacteria bacterium]
MNAITFDRAKAKYPIADVVTSFINGQSVPADNHGERLPALCPSTEDTISFLREADKAEVDAAVRAAREAFDKGPWPRMSTDERKRILQQIKAVLTANLDEIAYLETLNAGITHTHTRGFHGPRMAWN